MATIPVVYGEHYFGFSDDAGTNILYWSAVFSRILCDVFAEVDGHENLHEQFAWNPTSPTSLIDAVQQFVDYIHKNLWPCEFSVDDLEPCIECLRSIPLTPYGYANWDDSPHEHEGAMRAFLHLMELDARYANGPSKKRSKTWLETEFGLSGARSLWDIVPHLRSVIDNHEPTDEIGDGVPFTWQDMARFFDAFMLETNTFFTDATWETVQYEEIAWDTEQVMHLILLGEEAMPFLLAFNKFQFLSDHSAKFNEAVGEFIQDALDWYALEAEFSVNEEAELSAEDEEE